MRHNPKRLQLVADGQCRQRHKCVAHHGRRLTQDRWLAKNVRGRGGDRIRAIDRLDQAVVIDRSRKSGLRSGLHEEGRHVPRTRHSGRVEARDQRLMNQSDESDSPTRHNHSQNGGRRERDSGADAPLPRVEPEPSHAPADRTERRWAASREYPTPRTVWMS